MNNPEELRAKAAKCRFLARSLTDDDLIAKLLSIADEYEGEANRLEPDAEPPLPRAG